MILLISVSLAGLTYALGALIYALPLPLRGVKKWAPLLMNDAILTFVMSIMYSTIIYSANAVFNVLGVSREKLVSDIAAIANNVARLYLFFKMVKSFYDALFSLKIFGFPLGKVIEALYQLFSGVQPVGNWASSFTLELLVMVFKFGAYSWTFVYIVCVVSKLFMPFLLAIGTMMLGIPFRVTKSAGASLIGLALATYIVMPLVVIVLHLFGQYNPVLRTLLDLVLKMPTSGPTLGVAYPHGSVKDSVGRGIAYAYITFEDGSGHYGSYPTDEKGVYDTQVPLGGAPWPQSYVIVDLYGYKYHVGLLNLASLGIKDGSAGKLDIRLWDAYVPSPGIALIGKVEVVDFSAKTDTKGGITYISFKIVAKKDTKVTIIVCGVLEGQVSMVSSKSLRKGSMDITSWEGMPEYVIKFELEKGESVELVVYGQTGYFKPPSFYALGYLASLMGANVRETINEVAKYGETSYVLIVPFVVSSMPVIHALIVAAVARAIASLISESSKNLLVRMW